MLTMETHHTTQAIIDLSAIAHNLHLVRKRVGPRVSILATVKADAYGHGMAKVSQAALQAGADWLGVNSVWEGRRLREQGISSPILVLGLTSPREVPLIITHGLSQVISSLEIAQALSTEAEEKEREAVVHLKVDTGMGRLGVRPEEVLPFCQRLRKMPHIRLEGLMTHFAVSYRRDKSFTLRQLEVFQQIARSLETGGFHIPLRHAANSAAIIELPESHLDMVRPGIMLYGHLPSGEVYPDLPLRPALTFRTEIGLLKTLKPGESISYGRTFIAPREMRAAILPVGYADGYDRALSNRSHVLIRGHRAPVIGTVCMDMIAVDCTHIPGVQVGDEVALWGRQGSEEIPVEEIAALLKTISYEVLTGISSRVERIYLPMEDGAGT